MVCYEVVFIVRPDVSSAEVDKILETLTVVVKDNDGELVKTEYWGLRNLAYTIANNNKAHYVFMGINANKAIVSKLEQKMQFSESIIRFMVIKVDEISDQPSPILQSDNLKQR